MTHLEESELIKRQIKEFPLEQLIRIIENETNLPCQLINDSVYFKQIPIGYTFHRTFTYIVGNSPFPQELSYHQYYTHKGKRIGEG